MYLTRSSLPLLMAAGLSFLAADFAAAQNWLFFDPVQRQQVPAQVPQTQREWRVPAQVPQTQREWRVPAQYHRQVVPYPTNEAPGTIIVDTPNKFLYYVLPDGQAIRYGIGVGREGLWPTWTPPATMIKRQPELAKYASGMPGGPDNPLGARALYLYQNGKDTLFRIHGTNEIWSIGQSVSSGCIRMMNHDVIELHSLARIGAKVIVR
jgi:lipoprotein-anchoring transpeptidase ErfK/SrfK